MQKEIFIHIGTHKTGTTSIQNALMKHSKALKKSSAKFINLYNFEAAHDLMMLEQANDKISSDLKTFIDSRLEDDIQKYIICCEYLSGNPKSLYANSAEVAKVLFNALSDFSMKKIFVVLRHQEQFIQSIYTQYLHQGEQIEIERFMQKHLLSNLKWTQFCKSYGVLFGDDNIFAVPYDKAILESKNLINILGDFTSIDVLKTLNLENYNQGYSKKAAEIAKACTPYLSNEENNILRSLMQKHFHKAKFSRYKLLNDEQVSGLNEFYEADNEELFKTRFSNFQIENFSQFDEEQQTNELEITDNYEKLIVLLVKELNKMPDAQIITQPSQLNRTKTKLKKVLKRIIGRK
ncbi:hypothetical protein [Winogradskyella tangerina]|uniref:hypothetical protein n=1 Tax=Winogradskyella tangerina TaxID=2023240 RepID=UPI000DBE39AB|nr:hypothetical protein [Winogradskyella tangerina]